jgi:hypothetical protein
MHFLPDTSAEPVGIDRSHSEIVCNNRCFQAGAATQSLSRGDVGKKVDLRKPTPKWKDDPVFAKFAAQKLPTEREVPMGIVSSTTA